MEIKFENVSYSINKGTSLEKIILDNVSFEIKDYGIYSFVGASNSGKLAIGDLLNSLINPTSGKVIIKDNRGKINKINSLRFNVGYVFSNPYDMFFHDTVRDEINYSVKEFKYKTCMKIEDALLLVGLDESYLDLNPMILDIVDARKIALLCVLIYNPNIIILDDFTNGLGYNDKKELERLLRLLKNKYKMTIILLTKDTDFSYKVSDCVYLMHQTKIISSGDRELLTDEELLMTLDLEIPKIVSFINECKKKNHDIDYYTNIHDLIKGVYRDVF